jgi:hypothetical protein
MQRPEKEVDDMTVSVGQKTFPRRIVISADFGAGLVTWWGADQRAYDMIEHPALVAAAERGSSEEEAQQSLIDAGWNADYVSSLYWGGWLSAAVVEVNYPYLVQEYDGMETVLEKETAPWRT